MFITKAYAFIKKDFQSEISYKLSFLMQFFSIFVSVTVYYFMSQLFGTASLPVLARYGGNYFAFVLIGVAFTNYLEVSISGLSRTIRDGQMMGTLEALLVTQTNIPTIIISSSLYSFLFSSLRVVAFLVLGAVVFGLDLSQANYAGGFIILLLSIIAFSSFGILSASFVMVLKKGDPINYLFSVMSWLFGGIYFPIEILPQWLKPFCYILPITYSLEGMRLALLKGDSMLQLLPTIVSLVFFSIVLMPLSLLSFSYAVKCSKRDGSLTQY